MKIRSQSRGTMIERLQMVWTVLETNSVEMPGPKLEGALRWGGTWHVHEHKHGCIIRRRYRQKSSSETGLCSLGKRKCWKTNCPTGKEYSITFHPLSTPCCSLWGNCLTIPCSFWLRCCDRCHREGRENCLFGSTDVCKSTSECLSPNLSFQKKTPTQDKIAPELTALVYQDELLGTRCKSISLTKGKFADVVNAWRLLNTENKAAQEKKIWNFPCWCLPVEKIKDKANESRPGRPTSTNVAISPMKTNHWGVFRTTDKCLSLSTLGKVKNVQVILASGKQPLLTEVNLHRENKAWEWVLWTEEKKKKSENFRTESNLKTNHPISEVNKLRPRSGKCRAWSYIRRRANWNVILSLLGPYLSLHKQFQMEATKALSRSGRLYNPEFLQL